MIRTRLGISCSGAKSRLAISFDHLIGAGEQVFLEAQGAECSTASQEHRQSAPAATFWVRDALDHHGRLATRQPASISVQKPQCVGEFACAPWCVAWSRSTIVTATDATEATKIRSIVCVIPGKRCRQRRGSPRRDHLRGLLGSSRLGTSANPMILLSQSRHLIMCSMWQRCVTSVILFRQKAAGGQLAFLPIGAPATFSA
jgi:hypothetical protein